MQDPTSAAGTSAAAGAVAAAAAGAVVAATAAAQQRQLRPDVVWGAPQARSPSAPLQHQASCLTMSGVGRWEEVDGASGCHAAAPQLPSTLLMELLRRAAGAASATAPAASSAPLLGRCTMVNGVEAAGGAREDAADDAKMHLMRHFEEGLQLWMSPYTQRPGSGSSSRGEPHHTGLGAAAPERGVSAQTASSYGYDDHDGDADAASIAERLAAAAVQLPAGCALLVLGRTGGEALAAVRAAADIAAAESAARTRAAAGVGGAANTGGGWAGVRYEWRDPAASGASKDRWASEASPHPLLSTFLCTVAAEGALATVLGLQQDPEHSTSIQKRPEKHQQQKLPVAAGRASDSANALGTRGDEVARVGVPSELLSSHQLQQRYGSHQWMAVLAGDAGPSAPTVSRLCSVVGRASACIGGSSSRPGAVLIVAAPRALGRQLQAAAPAGTLLPFDCGPPKDDVQLTRLLAGTGGGGSGSCHAASMAGQLARSLWAAWQDGLPYPSAPSLSAAERLVAGAAECSTAPRLTPSPVDVEHAWLMLHWLQRQGVGGGHARVSIGGSSKAASRGCQCGFEAAAVGAVGGMWRDAGRQLRWMRGLLAWSLLLPGCGSASACAAAKEALERCLTAAALLSDEDGDED